MGGQIQKRYLQTFMLRHRTGRQEIANRFVEPGLSLDHKLSQRQRGKGLADGGDLEDGIRLRRSVSEHPSLAVLPDAHRDAAARAQHRREIVFENRSEARNIQQAA